MAATAKTMRGAPTWTTEDRLEELEKEVRELRARADNACDCDQTLREMRMEVRDLSSELRALKAAPAPTPSGP